MREAEPAFAVVRFDLPIEDEPDRVTVKEIVWSLDEAAREVARLNELNADKACSHFWTPTRVVERSPRTATSASTARRSERRDPSKPQRW